MKLEDIEKLCEEATPGPWGYCYDGSSDWSVGPAEDPQCKQIASCRRYHAVSNPDAQFIAASRTLMPKLLAVAKAAKNTSCCTPSQELFIALKELEKE